METGAGPQIALEASYARRNPPFSAHQFFPGDRTTDNMSGGKHASFSARQFVDSSPAAENLGSLEHARFNGHRMDWDVKTWDWNSVLFLAQPSSSAAGISDRTKSLYQGAQNGNPDRYHPTAPNGVDLRLYEVSCSPDQNGSRGHEDLYPGNRGKHPADDQDNGYPSYSGKVQTLLRDGSSPEEDAESLSLKLGRQSYACSDEGGNGSRDAKRYRSSSPGPQFPSCQVDDCKADLSHAKDYHRRHKVCEMHAKAVQALVCRLMQRFCQQCSRFHPLTEFDEGKRSCRRRLAGHNRRRRKNQPDTSTGRGYMGLDENGTGKAAELVGFLNLLTSLQAVTSAGALNGIVNERDALLQYLKKGALSPPNVLDNLTPLLNRSGVVSEKRRPDLKPESFTTNGHPENAVTETEALLSALAVPKTTEALSLLLQTSLRGQLTTALMKAAETPLVQVGQNNSNCSLPVAMPRDKMPNEVPAHPNTGPILSLSSPMAGRPLAVQNKASTSRPNGIHQQVIAENSVQQIEQFHAELLQAQVTPLAIAQKLFPLAQAGQSTVNVEDDGATESTSDQDAPTSMMTFLEGRDARMLQDVVSHHSRPTIDLQQPPSQYEVNESSPSGSDQSPSSSYTDWQVRTGRISIKLFDRNPGELPHLLRSQILDWLAHRPSDMESYIRPGCTVLTIFLSMPDLAWKELERDLRISLQNLAACCEFWSHGRVHMQVDGRNAFIVDGNIHVSRPIRTTNPPQLLSVRPIAVVAGQRTNIILRGSNLRQPETRIYCAYQGRYSAKGPSLADGKQGVSRTLMNTPENEVGYDEFSVSFEGGSPGVVGRAFIEVEKEMVGGNALPVIVADGPVCAELQMLDENDSPGAVDGEGAECSKLHHGVIIPHRIDANYFLNELGWLFQKSQVLPEVGGLPKFLPFRQKNLLTFAVERDWVAVVHKLLDILFGLVLASPDKTSTGLAEIFGDEVSFLHMAVGRRCRPMIQLLLSYVPYSGAGSVDPIYLKDICRYGSQHCLIFTPDMVGPEGLTPLHIAASMDRAEEIIDDLTNDPNQIGLQAWSNVRNLKGESPLACAVSRGNTSYVQLVTKKIARKDGSCIVSIAPKEIASNAVGKLSTNVCTKPVPALELLKWSNKDLMEKMEKARQGKTFCSPRRHVPPCLRGYRGQSVYRSFLLSMVAVAAVCVCACIIMKGPPQVECSLRPFTWRSLHYGSS